MTLTHTLLRTGCLFMAACAVVVATAQESVPAAKVTTHTTQDSSLATPSPWERGEEGEAPLTATLTGTLPESDTTLLVRNYFTGDTLAPVQIVGGAIQPVDIPLSEPIFAIIVRDKAHYLFILEDGPIYFSPDSTAGGPLTSEFLRIQSAWASYQHRLTETTGAGADLQTTLWNQQISLDIVRHSGDVVGLFAYMQTLETLPAQQALKLLESLEANQPQQPVLESIGRYVRAEVEKEETIGQPFIDFEVEYEGQVTRLSDYVGKGQLVLVDFWASWCGPCKREIPNLISVYNDYKDQGLVVLGVATWDKPEATLKAIDELGIPYPQILNAQKIGSDAYGITGIPEIILFSPDGTILARGLRGDNIRTRVEKELAK